MVDGLVVSAIGVAVVFVTLTIMMLLVMGMERAMRERKVAVESAAAGIAAVTTHEAKAAMQITVEPGNTAEVAAVALALASYLRGQGKQFEAGSISIGRASYRVEVGDISQPPVAISVNGERFWAGMNGEGLPVSVPGAPVPGARVGEAQTGRIWRSAYPLAQGGYWDRRGWSGRL